MRCCRCDRYMWVQSLQCCQASTLPLCGLMQNELALKRGFLWGPRPWPWWRGWARPWGWRDMRFWRGVTVPGKENKFEEILNKANLRDLIAATGLVISNSIQIVNFSACVTVKFDGWPCKNIGHLSYATSSFVHHFVAIGEYKLELQSGNAQSGSN